MKRIFILIALAIVVFASCDSVQINFSPSVVMPDSIKQTLIESAEEYYKFFNISRTLYIRDTNRKPIGSILILAEGSPETIVINNYFFQNDGCNVSWASYVFSHELFHTLHEDKIKFHSNSRNGKRIGFCGLSVIEVCFNEEQIFHTELEESAAEFCGSTVSGSLQYSNVYRPMFLIMKALAEKEFFNAYDLVDAAKKNDVPFLVGKILNKEKESVTIGDIMNIISIFEKAKIREDLSFEKYVDEILNLRLKDF